MKIFSPWYDATVDFLTNLILILATYIYATHRPLKHADYIVMGLTVLMLVARTKYYYHRSRLLESLAKLNDIRDKIEKQNPALN